MPSGALRSLAKKAHKSVETAERYWKEALKYAKKRSSEITDIYAYAMGVVKKRLGLSDSMLLDFGAPIDALVESIEVEEVRGFDRFDRVIIGALICEAYRVSALKKRSNAFFFNLEEGEARLRYSFLSEIKKVFSEKLTREELMKLFPNIPEEYIVFMLCERYSMEDLKKLFPGINLEYVRFLSG